MESLDLVTSNAEEARTWITGLRYLMAGISDEDSLAKRQRTHDQYPFRRCYVKCSVLKFVSTEAGVIFFLGGPLHTNCSLTCWTWLKQTFEEADKNGDGLLNIDEIYQLLHKLNVNLPRRKVKQMFQVRNEVTVTCLTQNSLLQNCFYWIFELQPHRHHTFVIF